MQKFDDENYVENILKRDDDTNEIQKLRKFTVELYDYNEKKLKIFNTTFEDFILNYYNSKLTDKNKLDLILNLYKNRYIVFFKNNESFQYDPYSKPDSSKILEHINSFFDGSLAIKISFYSNDLTDYLLDKINYIQNNADKIQEENKEILNKIQDYNKENLTIMGLIVSVVAIILTNVFNIANNIELKNVIVGNASIILGISAIFLFINIIFDRKQQDKEKYKKIWIIIGIAVTIIFLAVLLPNSISLKMIIGG